MGIGREVADAYISVHGDLTPFRESLNKANNSMADWAEKNADSVSKAWGKRMEAGWGKQWNSVIDSLYSGKKVDFNRMIEAFDPTDLDAASEKIHEMIGTMRELGKVSDQRSAEMIKNIDKEIKARQQAIFAQRDHAELQRGWHNAHLDMMEGLAAVRKRDAEAREKDYARWADAHEQMMEGLAAVRKADAEAREKDYARWADAHKQMMEGLKKARQRDADHTKALIENQIRDQKKLTKAFEDSWSAAIRENEKFNRSMDGMIKNIKKANLEEDFKKIGKAVAEVDWSNFAKGKTFEELRARVVEVTTAMRDQGRVSLDAHLMAVAGVEAHIDAMKAESKAQQDALDDARKAREEQERYNKSLYGMIKAVEGMDVEAKFKSLAQAIASNDFSGFARGTKNMEELRIKTLQTAEQLRDMGRIADNEFDWISAKIGKVADDMAFYNVTFDQANDKADRHKRDWTLISNLIGNAGKKFAGFTGLNVLTDMFREGASFFQDLDRNAVKIGKMSVLMGTAAASILHAVGGLAAMGQDLAALGSISILAPAFLTGAGIGIGVLVAAFKDMGDVLADLGPKFGKLQDSISAKFWGQAEEPIRKLTNQLLPTLSTQLSVTGERMGAIFAQLATSISTYAANNEMPVMFERLNAALDRGKAAVDPLVKAFALLGEVGSRYFGRAADAIVGMAEHFERFISAAYADGRLVEWTERAIQGFKDVGSVLSSAVGIFNAIGDAAGAAGIGGLGAFAAALAGASAIMQSPEFQHTLTMLLSGAAIAAREVGDAILNLGPAIASIMPTINLAMASIGDTMATVIGYIGQLMSNPAVQQGLTDFIGGISAGVAALAPAIGPIGDSLGQIGTILGQVAAQLGPLIAAFITGLAPVLDQVTAAFGRITFAAGPVIMDIINQLVPVFQNFVNTILPPLENLIMTVLPLLGPAFAALTPIIDALVPIWGSIVSGIGQLVAMIAPFLVPALQQISAAVTPVIEVLGQVVNFILSALVPILGVLLIGIINNVVGVFQGMSNFIMGAVQVLTAIFTGFGAFFTKLFQGDIGGALNALGTMFGQIWDGIVKMLQGALEFLWNAVQLLFIGKLIGGIKSGLTQMSGFFTSVWNSIVSFLKGAMNNINGTVMGGLNAVRGFFTSAWNAMLNIIRTAWNGITSAVSGGINGVMGWVRGLPGQISGALSNLWGLLTGAGKAIIDGFLSGLKSAWGAVTSFVGGIADWIAKNKGPLPYDRQLLVPAGQAIMDGLGNGLMSKLTMLKGVLDTVTGTMESSVTDAFAKSKMYVAGANAALGLADGLKSKKNVLANALSASIPLSATGAANIAGPGRAPVEGVGGSTPAGKVINIESLTIPVSTPTKNPEIVAAKVIDEFAATTSNI